MRPETERVIKKVAFLGMLLGAAIAALGVAVVGLMGPGRQAAVPGAIAVSGIAITIVSSLGILPVLHNSKCPHCRRWVHPWYRPSQTVHCPFCGKLAG